ncbi:hypothetical protein G6F64_013230 [Rhizopus arrhizus]|uniref:Uncharacterized protein n=1 Tax=Rhizopus oryzae TaxID=64495 RepID=A0A9P6WVY6_RHIOR|nr:hypothetical protein G6F64_013230 [Rhizopus arrhizus]
MSKMFTEFFRVHRDIINIALENVAGPLTIPNGITLNEKHPQGVAIVSFCMESSATLIWLNPFNRSIVEKIDEPLKDSNKSAIEGNGHESLTVTAFSS